MRTILPRPLPAHRARIAVTHPAGPADPARVAAGAALLAARSGWTVDVRPLPPSSTPWPAWLAGSDEARLAGLVDALAEADAVWAARGGYGCARLLEGLPADGLRRAPRWLVGFSDITALHLWAAAQGVASIHAANASGLGGTPDDEAIDSLVAALTLGRALPLPVRPALPGSASGRLIGGNLTVLASLAGTRWLPSLDGCLLLLEDVGEAPYRIDRALTSLLMDGRAAGLRGVVLGHFTRCGDDTDVVIHRCLELLGPLGIPVVRSAPVGHEPPNRALLLGTSWTLDGTAGRLLPDVQRMVTIQPAGARLAPALDEVTRLLDGAVREGIGSGAQLVVARGDEVVLEVSTGFTSATDLPHATLAHGPVPVRADTRFDLASLTKCLSTAVLAWQAIDEGLVTLDDHVPASISASAAAHGVTLRELLGHRSGLPAWRRIFPSAREAADPRHAAREAFAAIEVDPAARGRCVYSDPGYVLLGFWLESLRGDTLAALFHRWIAARADVATVGFRANTPDGQGEGAPRRTATGPAAVPLQGGVPQSIEVAVATEFCPWRCRVLHGIVHDEHAQLFGGAAGHAGLFGNAVGVLTILDALRSGGSLLSDEARDAMWTRPSQDEGSFTLGWDTPSGPASSAGSRMTRAATVGHLGFTGTSVWFDRARDLRIVLLTNRVHPSRDDDRIRVLRPLLHDRIVEAFTS